MGSIMNCGLIVGLGDGESVGTSSDALWVLMLETWWDAASEVLLGVQLVEGVGVGY